MTIYIGFKVNDVQVYQPITINLYKYCETILSGVDAAGKRLFACGSEEALLALGILNFANETYHYGQYYKKDGDTDDGTNAYIDDAVTLINAHSADCACKDKYDDLYDEFATDAATDVDPDGIAALKAAGIYGVGFRFNDVNAPGLVVYVEEANYADISKVVFKYNRLFTSTTSLDWYLSGGKSFVPTLTAFDKLGTGNTAIVRKIAVGDKNYVAIRFNGLEIYNIDATINITITKADGTTATAKYSIAHYINHFEGMAKNENLTDAEREEIARQIAPAKALYMFGKIAKDYKVYSNAERNNGEAKPNPLA